jgi:hypothetical protein
MDLRKALRRFELIVGLGLVAATAGAMVAAPLVMAIGPHLRTHRSMWPVMLVHTLLSRLWIYALLPLLCWGASRVVKNLRPWRTALGSALVGELCFLSLDWLAGALGTLADPRLLIPRLLTFGVGVYLGGRVIVWNNLRLTQQGGGEPHPP